MPEPRPPTNDYATDYLLPTSDHVVPRAKGGVNHHSNIGAAHMRCNHKWGDRMPSETQLTRFRKALQILKRERPNFMAIPVEDEDFCE